MERVITIDSLDELDSVAEAVLESLGGRTVVAFDAPMGAGKTTLISRISAQLGAEDDVITHHYDSERTRHVGYTQAK